MRPLARIAPAGDLEMGGGRRPVAPRKGVGAEPVAGDGVALVDRQRCFEMAPRAVGGTGAERALGFGEVMLESAGGHRRG